MNIEVGMKCKQIKPIEEYGFNYIGHEFEITKANEKVVMGAGHNGVFGIETSKFLDYFEIVKFKNKIEINEKAGVKISYDINQKVMIIKGVLKGVKGELVATEFSPDGYNYVSIQVNQDNIVKVKSTEIKPLEEKLKMNFKKHKFILSEEFKVYYSNEKVIAILQDGTKGIAAVHPEDKFDLDKGINIAYHRAKIQQMQKELNELCK